LKQKYSNFNPHLAIIQVGEREDSTVYVRQKEKAAKEVSFGNKYLVISMMHDLCYNSEDTITLGGNRIHAT